MQFNIDIKTITDFYKIFPEYKNKIKVNTRYGYKKIQNAAITSKYDTVYEVILKNNILKASKNHMLLKDNIWEKIINLNPGDKILTKNGYEIIIDIKKTRYKKDLYDIQVEGVNEYYSNNIVSHNSTIIDSLFFSLYGETIRELKKDEIVNYNTKSTTQVILCFKVTTEESENYYKIVETIKPSKLFLYRFDTLEDLKNNKITEDLTQTIESTKEKIIQILETTPEMFLNNYICDLGSTIPFLAQKGIAKRKYIEGIFSLDILTKMNSVIKEDYQKSFRAYDLDNAKHESLLENLKTYQEQQKNLKDKNTERINELKSRISNNKVQIDELKGKKHILDEKVEKFDKIEEKKEKKDNITKINLKIKDIISKIAEYNNEINTKKREKKELGNRKGICKECKRPFTDDEVRNNDELIKKLDEEIIVLEEKSEKYKKAETLANKAIKDIESIISDIENSINKYNLKYNENINIDSSIKSKLDSIKQYEEDIQDIQNDKKDFDEIIKNINERINISEKNILKTKDQMYIMDMSKFILSDEGVKSHIVKKLLSLLNERMNYYLKYFDSNCICTFNEYFEENMFNEKMQPVSYFNFSAGERKRIDLAMLFTFMDIRKIRTNITSNLLIFDELLDSSLDAIGIEKVIDLLKDRVDKYKEAIYIISHNIDAIKHATGEVVYLVKENGCTKRVTSKYT
jgi:ABC-type dipeptide/oligopeptide/nickel transport system ATPase subunit